MTLHTFAGTEFEITAEQAARFWSRVDRSAPCWTWRGPHGPTGFPAVKFRSKGRRHQTNAGRVAFELSGGILPPGHVADHKLTEGCIGAACITPEHMQAVTHIEDAQLGGRTRGERRRECLNGHPLTDGFWIFTTPVLDADGQPTGERRGSVACKSCAADRQQRYRTADPVKYRSFTYSWWTRHREECREYAKRYWVALKSDPVRHAAHRERVNTARRRHKEITAA